MMRFNVFFRGLVATLIFGGAVWAMAGEGAFHSGTIIKDFGKIADVETDFPIPQDTKFNIVFDTAKPAKPGAVNRTFDSAARFINMHAAAGVDPIDIKIAIVIHGKAGLDLTQDAFYATKQGEPKNKSAELIKVLQEHGVRFILCGQSAAYYDIDKSVMLPGTEMALSAMTAHALLQQRGYTLNPF